MKITPIAFLLVVGFAHADVMTDKYSGHPRTYHSNGGQSDAEIVRESQRRAAERQRAEIAERLSASQRREEALRQQRQQDRETQLQKYKQQQAASEERSKAWREKFDADQKALQEKLQKNLGDTSRKKGQPTSGTRTSGPQSTSPQKNSPYGKARAGEIVLNPATGKYERAAPEAAPAKKTTKPTASGAANTELHWNPVTKKYERVVREN